MESSPLGHQIQMPEPCQRRRLGAGMRRGFRDKFLGIFGGWRKNVNEFCNRAINRHRGRNGCGTIAQDPSGVNCAPAQSPPPQAQSIPSARSRPQPQALRLNP
jgi:hypothetical protein